MAQPPLHLIIGNYNTSSWSLRAWLVLRLARLAFIETRIPLRRPESPGRIAAVSPSGKLPVLLAEGVPIWDSLAIAEFIAELEPGIWPLDPIARAEARAISAEMHSGFADLRRLMPMDVIGRFSPPGRLPRGLAADIDRIKAIWGRCRAQFAPHGPFLFGPFSIADCMMAPVATRFVTHGVPVDGVVEDYVDSVMAWPDMVTWCDAAAAEQAQRDAQGSLGVVEINRPGRSLGRGSDEPSAGQPGPARVPAAPAIQLSPAPAAPQPDVEPATAAEESDAAAPAAAPWPDHLPAQPDHAAADAAAAAPEAAALPEPAPREPTPRDPSPYSTTPEAVAWDVEAASPAFESPPGAEPPVQRDEKAESLRPVEPELPAPRRRLFERAPSPHLGAGEPQTEDDSARETAPDEPAAAERRSVPPAPAKPAAGPAIPSREAAAGSQGSGTPPPPKLGWIRRPVPTDQLDADAPFAADEVARPRSPTARPSSPAVKPIGGGILRRR